MWLLGRRLRVRVSGRSMLPVLTPGDEVLAEPGAAPRPGDIVVARHPLRTDTRVVKRLEGWDERGAARLVGLNPAESSDSRTFGGVPADLLVGPVRSRLPASPATPKDRRP